jgi:excisionase family DNA binding protein
MKISDQEPVVSQGPVLTSKEAAAFLRISVRKLQLDAAARRLPYIKLGRRLLFRKAALERALERAEVAEFSQVA